MRRTCLIFALAALPSLFATTASAQSLVHGGVLPEQLVPAGLHLVDVTVPAVDARSVHLGLAPTGQRTSTHTLDVDVAADATTARARLTWFRQTVSGEFPAIRGLGDEAYGDAGLLAFVRDNVFVVVRRIAAGGDVAPLAAHIDRAIAAAPAGATSASSPSLRLDEIDEGESRAVQTPADLLAMHLVAEGDAYARRTRTGWVVTRTGPGEYRVRVRVVDQRLRQSR